MSQILHNLISQQLLCVENYKEKVYFADYILTQTVEISVGKNWNIHRKKLPYEALSFVVSFVWQVGL